MELKGILTEIVWQDIPHYQLEIFKDRESISAFLFKTRKEYEAFAVKLLLEYPQLTIEILE